MRIALLSPYALDAPGGVQDQVLGLGARLTERGHTVVCVGPAATPMPGVVVAGRPVSWRANGSVAPLTIDPRAIAHTRRALSGVDIVHVHEPLVPWVGWAGLAGHGGLVATFHADPSAFVRKLYASARPLGRRLFEKAAVSAVSATAASAARLLGLDPAIIPNGVDVESYGNAPRTAGTVAFLGRDDPRKGLDVLLAAWPEVRRRHPGAELVVIGTERPDLPGVTFAGRVDEATKRELLSGAAVFCAPNLGGESFGITLVEGMASGCAVVASSLPAFAAVLEDAGELVPPGDSAVLARTIVDLLEDPVRIEHSGEAARRRALLFDWDRVVDAYESLYASVLPTMPA